MDAHDQLTREEVFQLDILKDEMILCDQVELLEVLVLFELLQYDLLLSKRLLEAPEMLPSILFNKDHLCVVLHGNDPA